LRPVSPAKIGAAGWPLAAASEIEIRSGIENLASVSFRASFLRLGRPESDAVSDASEARVCSGADGVSELTWDGSRFSRFFSRFLGSFLTPFITSFFISLGTAAASPSNGFVSAVGNFSALDCAPFNRIAMGSSSDASAMSALVSMLMGIGGRLSPAKPGRLSGPGCFAMSDAMRVRTWDTCSFLIRLRAFFWSPPAVEIGGKSDHGKGVGWKKGVGENE
jgi:hypothetical protein